LKRGQKLCPNLFIKKKKRIAQLINGKPGIKTDTTKPYDNNNQNRQPPTQQAPPTYDTWSTTQQ
jgi:hypothetical protein